MNMVVLIDNMILHMTDFFTVRLLLCSLRMDCNIFLDELAQLESL